MYKTIFYAISRNQSKLVVLFLLGLISVYLVDFQPMWFGEIGAPLVRGFGICFIALGAGILAQAIIEPHVSSRELIQQAKEGNNASGLIFIGRSIVLAIILILIATASRAEQLPPNALNKLPILKQEAQAYWPELKLKAYLGAQIEQETCISLKHKKCWSESAQLLTSREQGVGLGQLTRAFKADGTIRFDALSELKAKHPRELKDLSWTNWQDTRLQLRAVVLKDKDTCSLIKNTATQDDQLRMCMAAYNGGSGGLSNDRLACRAKAGCNPAIWYGHVENTSMKSKTVIPGYGRSPFQINREYVVNIDRVRKPRYLMLNT